MHRLDVASILNPAPTVEFRARVAAQNRPTAPHFYVSQDTAPPICAVHVKRDVQSRARTCGG